MSEEKINACKLCMEECKEGSEYCSDFCLSLGKLSNFIGKLTELGLKIDAYRNYQNNCSYTDKLKGKIETLESVLLEYFEKHDLKYYAKQLGSEKEPCLNCIHYGIIELDRIHSCNECKDNNYKYFKPKEQPADSDKKGASSFTKRFVDEMVNEIKHDNEIESRLIGEFIDCFDKEGIDFIRWDLCQGCDSFISTDDVAWKEDILCWCNEKEVLKYPCIIQKILSLYRTYKKRKEAIEK